MDPTIEEDTINKAYESIPGRVIARFHTNTDYKMSQGHNQIQINTDYNEQALNIILQDMLELTQKINFDFLINGKLLMGNIKSHLVRYQISCEQVIDIQYVLAFVEYDEETQTPVQDWVSCICEVMGEDSNIGVLSATFEGTIQFHKQITKKRSSIKALVHDSPIKSIKAMPSEKQNVYYIISGGLDEELKVSKFGIESSPEVISINNHEGSVLAIDFNPSLSRHVCTSGASGNLNVWQIPENFLSEEEFNEVKTQKKKKRKTNKKNLPFLAKNQSHKDAINSICWITSSTVATGSSDHSIKLTDVQKMREHRTFLTKDSITTSLDYSLETLFSSHEDGYIRTWDLRSQNTTPIQTYKSHSRFASSVKKQPHTHNFATGSYDQTVKIWDTRSLFPVQTIMPNYEKIFCVGWRKKNQLVSGGSNPFLTFHTIGKI